MIPETHTYIERLREMRGNVLKTLDAMSSSGLNFKPTRKDTNSLFILATHLLGSERGWIHQFVGQREVKRDRDAEFRARGASTDALKDAFAEVARTSDEILGALTSADLDVEHKGNHGSRTVRWGVLHVIEHYSEHLGQMSLTRQLWEERKKTPSAKHKTPIRRAKAKRKN